MVDSAQEILTSLHPHSTLESSGIKLIGDAHNKITQSLARQCAALLTHDQRQQCGPSTVTKVVESWCRKSCPNILDMACADVARRVDRYQLEQKQSSQSTGLILDSRAVRDSLLKNCPAVTVAGAIAACAVIEYLLGEMLQAGYKQARRHDRRTLTSHDISRGISKDVELTAICDILRIASAAK